MSNTSQSIMFHSKGCTATYQTNIHLNSITSLIINTKWKRAVIIGLERRLATRSILIQEPWSIRIEWIRYVNVEIAHAGWRLHHRMSETFRDHFWLRVYEEIRLCLPHRSRIPCMSLLIPGMLVYMGWNEERCFEIWLCLRLKECRRGQRQRVLLIRGNALSNNGKRKEFCALLCCWIWRRTCEAAAAYLSGSVLRYLSSMFDLPLCFLDTSVASVLSCLGKLGCLSSRCSNRACRK